MDKSRRTFLHYLSVAGVLSISGISLQAMTFDDRVLADHSFVDDEYFDPDGWL